MMNPFVIPVGRKNPTEIQLLKGERDALLVALRKFREESPPRPPFDSVENSWDQSMDDDDSSGISDSLKLDARQWSISEAKDLSQFNDLQGSDPLLTHNLFTTVYPDPFFFLGEETSRILNDIMSLGNIWNLGHSQCWRADTLRLIHPLRKSPDEVLVRSETKKLLHKAAISRATKFMRSPAKFIMNGHPDALQKLEDLYMQAAEHSCMIWGWRPMIKLLDASYFLGQPFDLQNSNMRAVDRVFQATDLNPNGQQISMVSSPAILRYGLYEANAGYYEKRWWHDVLLLLLLTIHNSQLTIQPSPFTINHLPFRISSFLSPVHYFPSPISHPPSTITIQIEIETKIGIQTALFPSLPLSFPPPKFHPP
ncbi:hypothetical protein BHYA_0359g00060 [Botrytis hyacinthi]|uniref:Uncharacterized protein n=1 Tax=Botrytis hyacinthi TaxID=278943 RepID=A0A4Z1GCV4_9HELO|nr:hypothetical protein BHYA_0359g00060 [Botrytis hyacinthi]